MRRTALAALLDLLVTLAAPTGAPAQPGSLTDKQVRAISTPDRVETRIGALEFRGGAPSAETVAKVYDNLDFTHAFDTFLNTFQSVNMNAAHKGFRSIGVKDNEILVFSRLMNAKSLFLTANADTVNFMGFIDLTKGPIMLETPPDGLATLNDFWWRLVIVFGPDRGQGGKYLILPPDYSGSLPQGGYHVARSRTTRVLILGRELLVNNGPSTPAELIRKRTRTYPYVPGGKGTSSAELSKAVGTVKWFNATKGYGFIMPQDGGKDVFVHITAVQAAGLKGLNDGQKVSYDVAMERGKAVATNLKLLSDDAKLARITPPPPTGSHEASRITETPCVTASPAEIASKIKKLVTEQPGVNEAKVTPEASFVDELGADSLDVVELIMSFEEAFGVEISEDNASNRPGEGCHRIH